jgi:hypothetical protein
MGTLMNTVLEYMIVLLNEVYRVIAKGLHGITLGGGK